MQAKAIRILVIGMGVILLPWALGLLYAIISDNKVGRPTIDDLMMQNYADSASKQSNKKNQNQP